MKRIKRMTPVIAGLAGLVLLGGGLAMHGVATAQPGHADHGAGHVSSAQAGARQASGAGEVRRVDKAGARLTIRHGELKEIDMPPMTMVFQVRDGALLDTVKVGDRIRFTVISEADKLTVISLQVVP